MEDKNTVSSLLMAVVQSQDSDMVSWILNNEGYTWTNLPSAGGFLREKNVTYLIACNPQNQTIIQQLLSEAARKRVSYVAAPIDNSPLPMTIPAETMIGGITFFTLAVDHYEEI